MNAYAWIILAFLLANYLLNLVADLLNLSNMGEQLPAEFEDAWDAERYRTSQRYIRDNTRLGIASSTCGLAVLLAFWFSGGFNWLDHLVRSAGLSPVPTGLLFIGALLAASGLGAAVFSAYSVFVIEERYGFNRTTPATFIKDRIKMAILAVVLGGPVLAAVLAFFRHAGPDAWLYCWIAASAFILFIQYIAPTFLLPLFNRFEPMKEGEVRDAVLEYLDGQEFEVKNLFVMDGSRRTAKANALFTGLGSKKRIAMFDTLLERHDTDEVVAVVAHEVGHYKMRHVVKGMAAQILHLGLLFLLLSLFLESRGLYEAFFMDRMSVYAGLVFFGLLYSPVETVVLLALQAWSRKNEYEADRYAVRTTGKTEPMARALLKLSRDNLSNLTPHPLAVLLRHTHPPVLDRIRALRKQATA
ncbi:MAG: M48 family metallopeptidase [Desulfatibacillaceae bacterium]